MLPCCPRSVFEVRRASGGNMQGHVGTRPCKDEELVLANATTTVVICSSA